MTPDQQFYVALIGQLAILIGAIGAVWAKLERVHLQINSRMDQLLELTAASSEAKGFKRAGDMSASAGGRHPAVRPPDQGMP